jgi:4-hydroxythreonine-4-phosphate dehydrogenase
VTPLIAVTSGEPAGIGPDICLELAQGGLGARIVVIGDRELLRSRASALGKSLRIADYRADAVAADGTLEVAHVALPRPAEPGRLDPRNSPYVLAVIDRAFAGCAAGEFSAMVTAPVQKSVINDAGMAFSGHTEYLAEAAGGAHVVMMLVGAGLRVALATTHLALKDVSAALTATSLERTLRVLVAALQSDFSIKAPRVIVSGLNPHGGEGGYLGREEIETIAPVVERLRAEGMDLVGPLPADTLFNPQRLRGADCVLAMYHDQGLPVLKYASFGEGVNITLGLPVIRTSVDHGTALDLAGSGRADPGSLRTAVEAAIEMARARAGG